MAAAGSGGGGGSTAGIRAGRAFVEIFTKDDQFKKGLAGMRATLNKWGAGLAKVGGIGAGLGGAVLGAFGLIAKGALDSAGALADMSARLGVSVEELNALGYAAELAGAGLEEVEVSVGKMQQAMADGKQVGDLNLGSLIGLELPAQIDAIADALAGVNNSALRSAMAVDIFGKAGRKMVPFLADGAAGMRRMREEAALTTGVTKGQVDALDEVGDAVTRMIAAAKSIGTSIAVAVFGDPKNATEFAASVAGAAKGIRELVTANAPLIQGLAIGAAAITGISLALGGLGVAALAVSAGLKAVGAILATVFTAKFFAISGIAAALAGVVGLLVKFGDAGKYFGTAWDGMMRSVKSGQLELAFKIAFAAIRAEWHNLMVQLSSGAAAAAILGAAGAAGAAKGGLPGSIAAGAAAMTGLTSARLNALQGLEEARAEMEQLLKQVENKTEKAKGEIKAVGAMAASLGGPTRGGFGTIDSLTKQFGIIGGDSMKAIEKNTARSAKADEKTAQLLEKFQPVTWAA